MFLASQTSFLVANLRTSYLYILLDCVAPFANIQYANLDDVAGVLYTIAVYGVFAYGTEKSVGAFLLLLNPPGDIPYAMFV